MTNNKILSRNASLRFSTFLLCFLSSISIASEDGGESPMLLEEVIALEAKAYAETYNVSEDEAVRRLALMHDSSVALANISTEVGDELGGIYFDNGPDFSLTINTTVNGILIEKIKYQLLFLVMV